MAQSEPSNTCTEVRSRRAMPFYCTCTCLHGLANVGGRHAETGRSHLTPHAALVLSFSMINGHVIKQYCHQHLESQQPPVTTTSTSERGQSGTKEKGETSNKAGAGRQLSATDALQRKVAWAACASLCRGATCLTAHRVRACVQSAG